MNSAVVTWLFLGWPQHEVVGVLDGLRDVGHELPGQSAVGVLLVPHGPDVDAQALFRLEELLAPAVVQRADKLVLGGVLVDLPVDDAVGVVVALQCQCVENVILCCQHLLCVTSSTRCDQLLPWCASAARRRCCSRARRCRTPTRSAGACARCTCARTECSEMHKIVQGGSTEFYSGN